MAGYTSPLGRLLPNAAEGDRIKQAAWREDKILVVRLDDERLDDERLDDERLDFVQREFIRQIGEMLFGKPKAFTSKPRKG